MHPHALLFYQNVHPGIWKYYQYLMATAFYPIEQLIDPREHIKHCAFIHYFNIHHQQQGFHRSNMALIPSEKRRWTTAVKVYVDVGITVDTTRGIWAAVALKWPNGIIQRLDDVPLHAPYCPKGIVCSLGSHLSAGTNLKLSY